MMEEDKQQRSYNKDPKHQKINRVNHQLKNIIILRNKNQDKLLDYMYDLCQLKPNRDQLKPLDKMIRSICTRLQSALQMVDQFVIAIKCLQLSTHCVQDVFSEEDFNKCLKSIEELSKRAEINGWISNIKKYIDSKKQLKSVISSTRDKKQQIKMLEQVKDQSKFIKKENIIKPKCNQQQSIFQVQPKKDQIKQRLSRTQKSLQKYSNYVISNYQNKKQDIYSEKQKKMAEVNELEVNKAVKSENVPEKIVQKLKTEDQPIIPIETQIMNHQNQSEIKDVSTQHQVLNRITSNQIQNQAQDRAKLDQEEQDRSLIKTIFMIRNASNLNFLKNVLWDKCRFQIRKAEKIYSSEQMQEFHLDQRAFRNKNILLTIQLINGLVVGGFKRHQKYTQNQRNRGLLFSLSRKESFTIIPGNLQLQLLKLNQKEIIFGRDQLKINYEEMIVKSNFGSGKGVFDCKKKDLDYLIGEGTQKTAEIMEYAIYQII